MTSNTFKIYILVASCLSIYNFKKLIVLLLISFTKGVLNNTKLGVTPLHALRAHSSPQKLGLRPRSSSRTNTFHYKKWENIGGIEQPYWLPLDFHRPTPPSPNLKWLPPPSPSLHLQHNITNWSVCHGIYINESIIIT